MPTTETPFYIPVVGQPTSPVAYISNEEEGTYNGLPLIRQRVTALSGVTTVTGTGSTIGTTIIAPTDVSDFREVSLQITMSGNWNGMYGFFASNDGNNWDPIPLSSVQNLSQSGFATGTVATIWTGGLAYSQFKCVVTSSPTGGGAGGTVTGTALFFTSGRPSNPGTVAQGTNPWICEDVNSSAVETLVAATSAPTTGVTASFGTIRGAWSLQVDLATGSAAGVVISFQVSNNGSKWWQVGLWDQTGAYPGAGGVAFVDGQFLVVADNPALVARAVVLAITGGSVSAWITAS